MHKFRISVYDGMLENFECWFVLENGNAMIINDCSLLEC